MQNQEKSKKLLLIKATDGNYKHGFSSPPLGIMSIASIARERCGWDVRLLDTFLHEYPEKTILDLMTDWTPDVVGFSAFTAESINLHRYAKVVRKALPKAIILAGGPHPSQYPDETLENLAIDGAVIYEGDVTVEQILNSIAKGESWSEVKGIAVRGENGQVLKREAQTFIADLDTLPFPAWDLVDISAYAVRQGNTIFYNRRYMPMITSRGCPYHCTYCHESMGKQFRAHSSEYVLRMINALVDSFQVYHFDILDDIFNLNRKRMDEILDTLIEKGPSIRFAFPNALRADILTEEQIDKLCRAGCEYVALAVETASSRLQKHTKKNLNVDKVMESIKAFARQRVFTVGYFMLGFPTETEDEIKQTYDFAFRSPLHMAYFSTVSPFQGTELYEESKDSMACNARDLTANYIFQSSNLSEVPDKRFFRLKAIGYFRFYFNPLRFYRIYRDIPKRKLLWKCVMWILLMSFLFMFGFNKLSRPQSPAEAKV